MSDGLVLEDERDKRTKALKELTLVNNLHNLHPSVLGSKDENEGVAIVNALKSDKHLLKVAMQLEGKFFNQTTRQWDEFRGPVMNKRGIGNFLSVLTTISETIEFGNFSEKEIPKQVTHLFKMNYPYFTIYFQDYELDRKDFNLIATLLFSFILSSFKKAQGAGHRNVVRGTYSEDLLGKYVSAGIFEGERQKKSGSKFSFMNPFKKPEGSA